MTTTTQEIDLSDLPASLQKQFPNRQKVKITVEDVATHKDYGSVLRDILNIGVIAQSYSTEPKKQAV